MADQATLNAAYRDLLDAAKRVQRLTDASVHVDLHIPPENESEFFGLDFVWSDWESEDGDPKYGHVEGQKHGYLSRMIFRGDGVLAQLFMNTPIRRKASIGA